VRTGTRSSSPAAHREWLGLSAETLAEMYHLRWRWPRRWRV
ncbi:MAG: hypothetical protein AVDCRST_MAG87-2770, partial [uncultured Thermomicrobiales bacterium]